MLNNKFDKQPAPREPVLSGGRISEEGYRRLTRFLEDQCGIVLGPNKQYLVSSRLRRLLGEFGLEDFDALARAVDGPGQRELKARVVDAMTTNETLWFRDGGPYRLLQEHILPQLEARRLPSIKIWSAACSTGQEPYSISMVVEEYKARHPGSRLGEVRITATDISPTALAQARAGLSDEAALGRGVTRDIRDKYFEPKNGLWAVKPKIKSRVQFMELNLKDSFARLGKFQVIFCRNVLIYFSAQLKGDILDRMADALTPPGYLILGSSETPNNYSDRYRMVRTPQGVFYRPKEHPDD